MILLAGIFLGLLYPVFGDGFGSIMPFINGLVIGIVCGLFAGITEVFFFTRIRQKFSFISLLILRVLVYFTFFAAAIVFIMAFNYSIYYKQGFMEYFLGERFQHFLWKEDFIVILFYCLGFLILIFFTRQMGLKMGPGVLFNLISGRYRIPREEERILMFLDLHNSTSIAEKIGDLRYHNLLNEFFNDITKCILVTEGEIYRYVGDEIAVTWKIKKGLKNANCIRTYFLIKHEMRKQREKYINLFGLVPSFSTGFHYGKVVHGEIGDVKSQIVFHGETMYITTEIQKRCSTLKTYMLISEELIQRLTVPSIYIREKVGILQSRISNKDLALYTLKELDPNIMRNVPAPGLPNTLPT